MSGFCILSTWKGGGSSPSILSFSSVSSSTISSVSVCSFTILSSHFQSANYLSSWVMLLRSTSYMHSYKLFSICCWTLRHSASFGGRNVWVYFDISDPPWGCHVVVPFMLLPECPFLSHRILYSFLWPSRCSSSIRLYPSLVLEFPPLVVTLQRDCLWMLPLWFQCLTFWLGFNPRTLQPVEIHHTDYATRPTENQISPHKSRTRNWRMEETSVNMSKCRNNIKMMTYIWPYLLGLY